MFDLISIKRCRLIFFICWALVIMVGAGFLHTAAYAANVSYLPAPGTMVNNSKVFAPVVLRGLSFDVNDPLKISFIVDEGNTNLSEKEIREESKKLIRYFLAALTTKGEDMWVNLSPYEQDRIIPAGLGETDIGRDMLAQDYILKQLSASLSYPGSELGKKYWSSQGNNVSGFNKVWIAPDITQVEEINGKVFITKSTLKVQMEEDYTASRQAKLAAGSSSNIVISKTADAFKAHILPVIVKEVNEGANFAVFRQLHSAVILAVWFKSRLKDSIYQRLYIDKGRNNGIENDDPNMKEKIFNQYVEAFKKGVYNQVESQHVRNKIVKRAYFSGGINEQFGAVSAAAAQSGSIQATAGSDEETAAEHLSSAASGRLTHVTVAMSPAVVFSRKVTKIIGFVLLTSILSACLENSVLKHGEETHRDMGAVVTNFSQMKEPPHSETPEPEGEDFSSAAAQIMTKRGGFKRPVVKTRHIGADIDLRGKIASGCMTANDYRTFIRRNPRILEGTKRYLTMLKNIVILNGLTEIVVDASQFDAAASQAADDAFSDAVTKLINDNEEPLDAIYIAAAVAVRSSGGYENITGLIAQMPGLDELYGVIESPRVIVVEPSSQAKQDAENDADAVEKRVIDAAKKIIENGSGSNILIIESEGVNDDIHPFVPMDKDHAMLNSVKPKRKTAGGIIETDMQIKVKSDNKQISFFNSVMPDENDFGGFTFIINSISRNKSVKELVQTPHLQ